MVKRFTPHGVRRAVVDHLQVSGVDVGTAQELLGHAPEVMLEH
jgi:site-specific recombinase XerD